MACEILLTASSSRRAAPASTSTTPGGAACSAPSSADSSPVVGDGNVTTIYKKSSFYPRITCFAGPCSAAMYLLMDAAAAALDARRLQTFANIVDQHLGTSTLQILSSDLLNKRTNHAQFERYQTRNARETRHTPASAASASLSPPVHQALPRSSCCRSLASPCAPWRNDPLRIAPCCCEE